MEDPRSDAELLSAVRAGDRDAYAGLWKRHVGPAYRYAQRLYPSRVDDLVSESFLAIYQLVTTSDKGPDFAFRSYLKAVIRNTAIKWSKEAQQLEDVEHEQVDFRDALSIIETESNATDLLDAFQALPERWQRVLWMAEVAEAERSAIADEFGIKPNAVSALQRRARTGLKLQWLTLQIPDALRDDATHAARLFPRYLTDPHDTEAAVEVTAHVETCELCADLLDGARGSVTRIQRVTLAGVGLGALGTTLPAAGSLTSGTVAAAAVVATGSGLGIGTASLVTGISALTIVAGWLGVIHVVDSATDVAEGAEWSHGESARDAGETATGPTAPVASPSPAAVPTMTPPPATAPPVGRGISDEDVDTIDLIIDPAADAPAAPPARPQPVGTPVPEPPADPGAISPDATSPGVTTPTAYSGYVAPVIAGVVTPGSAVAVAFDGQQFAPTVDENGAWSFDPRSSEPIAGTYEYRVWSYDATTTSPVTTGSFTILPILIEGFEQTTGFEDMLLDEARTTGLVIAATGPENGRIFINTIEGHSAMITLDDTGHARVRLRMNSTGWYYFTFRALDEEDYWGPSVEKAVDVYDPEGGFSPWGPDPDEMTFDIDPL